MVIKFLSGENNIEQNKECINNLPYMCLVFFPFILTNVFSMYSFYMHTCLGQVSRTLGNPFKRDTYNTTGSTKTDITQQK